MWKEIFVFIVLFFVKLILKVYFLFCISFVGNKGLRMKKEREIKDFFLIKVFWFYLYFFICKDLFLKVNK